MWRASRGFTLMELLVVLAIMGLVLSLAAPAGVQLAENAERRRELAELQVVLRSLSHKAWLRATPITVQLAGGALTARAGEQTLFAAHYDFLQLGERELTLSSRGIASPAQFEVSVRGGNPVRLDLSEPPSTLP